MQRRIGVITSSLILSSNLLFGANSLEDALMDGTTSGRLEVYSLSQDNKGGNADVGYVIGAFGLSYETATYKNFSAKVSFLGADALYEKHKGDSKGDVESNAMIYEANVKYENENLSLKVGRQEVNLEWMSDYHQGIMGTISAIPDTSILLGYSQKLANADADEFSDTFNRINGNKGIYVADIIYSGFTDLELNPYIYVAPNLSDLYGIKATYFLDDSEISAQYAKSSEESINSGYNNGSIMHFNINSELFGVEVATGYVKTGKNGTGSIIHDLELGDNISPLEDGNYVYDSDAKTIYGSASYSIDDIGFGLVYGETKYQSKKENELNLSAEIEIIEDVVELEILYVNVDANDSVDDYNKLIFELEYTF